MVRVPDAAGNWVSRACECQEAERERRRVAAAQIPTRYRDCTLDTFDPSYPGADPALGAGMAGETINTFIDPSDPALDPLLSFTLPFADPLAQLFTELLPLGF